MLRMVCGGHFADDQRALVEELHAVGIWGCRVQTLHLVWHSLLVS
jgi:hypothetical protein